MLCLTSTTILATFHLITVVHSEMQLQKVPLSKPKEICLCLFQVQFGETEEDQKFLSKQHKVFTCDHEDDFYECRLLCAYQMMNPRTHNPHARGRALNEDMGETVNIVQEACRLQEMNRVTVDIRYQLCDEAARKFVSFVYCCEPYLFIPESSHDEEEHMARLANKDDHGHSHEHSHSHEHMDSHEARMCWRHTTDDDCYLQ